VILRLAVLILYRSVADTHTDTRRRHIPRLAWRRALKILSKFVGIFYKLQHKLPNTVLCNIYFAFICPHLIYGIKLYGNTFHTFLDKLLKLNNKLFQILQGKNKRSHVKDLYVLCNTLL